MKPIIFNTEMVQAILEGRKTVTRRKIKLDLGLADMDNNDSSYLYIPVDTQEGYIHAKELCRYQPGDTLYVRGTWQNNPIPSGWPYDYKATPEFNSWEHEKWKPSIHMPKAAARIFLKVTDVRVERVKDITDKEAKKEGVRVETNNSGLMYKAKFVDLWNEIYGDWKQNPYVWVVEFEVMEEGKNEKRKCGE